MTTRTTQYNRILVPLDGSRLAEYILPHVESLAAAFVSEVTLLHVIESKERDPEALTQSQKDARADIAKYLEGISGALAKKRLVSRWLISYGDPAEEIVRHSANGLADIVMMSTHGSGGRENSLGSVAMAVVSWGATPVTLVRPPEKIARR
ncbi:MAG: universal stress protein [Chloroflexi bacterium]|nr:universal stress protein [Chloroflexota bacterium]